MKSKYYLRGFGTGVLFATIILMISLMVHDNMASNQKTDKGGSTGVQNNLKDDMTSPENTTPPESNTPSESTTPSESDTPSESTVSPGTTTQPIPPETTAQPEESTTPPETTAQPESTTPPETTTQPESEAPQENTLPQENNTDNAEYVTLNITSGMSSNKVADELQKSGVVESGYDLNMYLYNNGYENKIRVGTYSIRKGSSYQEIAEAITTRR